MKKLIFILFTLYAGNLFSQQNPYDKYLKKKEGKIAIKDIKLRNIQFEFEKSILEDSIIIQWYEHTKVLSQKFPECEFFNPGNDLQGRIYQIPSATRFKWLQFSEDAFNIDSLIFKIAELQGSIFSYYHLPFYFKNHEVTNKEYREFVTYVCDSIARRLLASEFPEEYLIIPIDNTKDPMEGDFPLNWKKEFSYNDEKLEPYLISMYYPDHEKFYWRKQFDRRKLIYKYYTLEKGKYSDIEGMEDGDDMQPHKIAIYPDTISWINNFHSPNIDPKWRNYFWHEAYDDYPVVGMTWEQANAFCIWKTDQLSKKLAKEKFPFTVEITLPKDYEWEYVLSQYQNPEYLKPFKYYPNFPSNNPDLDWKTNLIFKWSDKFVQEIKFDIIKKSGGWKYNKTYSVIDLISSDNELGNYYQIAEFGPYLLRSHDAKSVKNKVDYWSMAYNSSEWMDEEFDAGYERNWGIRVGAMMSDTSENHLNAFRVEINNYAKNQIQKGKLVRGSNWFDQGLPETLPFIMSYANRKAFVPADSAYSTMGFRYVIRLTPK